LLDPNDPNHGRYTGDISFSEYVEAALQKGKKKAAARFRSQYSFIAMTGGEIGVDRIFSLDRLDLLTDYLKEKTGCVLEIPVKNVSPQRDCLELDDELLQRLEEYLWRDRLIYNFVREKGSYDKAQHFDELAAILESKRRLR
jgi:hypothetical protein